MSISKITNAPTPNEHIAKTNEIIDVVNNGGSTATDVQINSTSITSNNIANIITNSAYNASSNKIATMSDLPSIPTNISAFNNDSGYITGINSSDVTTALGYTPANDSGVVHNTGNETIAGSKIFDTIRVDDITIKEYENGNVVAYSRPAFRDLSNVQNTITSIPPTLLYNFDGQWVSSYVKIVDSVSNTSGTNIYLDSNGTSGAGQNYLPNDNYNYEVIFQIRLGCNTSQSGNVTLSYGTDIINTNLSADYITINKNGIGDSIAVALPVGTDRYFKYALAGATSNTTICRVCVLGYRRIGTNS